MLHIILYIIPVFIVYSIIRSGWVSNETLKTKYKLTRLQEELTWLVITGEISSTNKEYIQLSESINKVLMVLPRFNFWVMIYLLVKEKHEVYTEEIEKVRNEVGKQAPLIEIFDRYHKIVMAYVARKNIISVLLTIPIWKKILEAHISAKGNKRAKFNNADECIEISAYTSFAFYFQKASTKSILLG
ncbi:MAG TPA: hypothetical protein VF008_28100 [Niastella sp.]